MDGHATSGAETRSPAAPADGPTLPAAGPDTVPAAGPTAVSAAGPTALPVAGPAVLPAAGPAVLPAAERAALPAAGLDGIPRQPRRAFVEKAHADDVAGGHADVMAGGDVDVMSGGHAGVAEDVYVGSAATADGIGSAAVDARPFAAAEPALAPAGPSAVGGAASVGPRFSLRRRVRPWRLLPTPAGTPFTFWYAVVLAVTSLFAVYGDQDLVDRVLQGSSTDVAHLAQAPVHVLVASALWIAGGVTSAYVFALLLVLTALERRIGGWRAAGVFLLGHVLATLATEVPVGLSVLVGHLPDSSLHRYDYGISFGVATCVGALAGLLTPWLRWTVLAVFGWMVVGDLFAFADPMTNWGHLMALTIGVAVWPLVRSSPRAATETTV